MRTLRLAIVERLPQKLRESGASHVLDHLLLAMALLPLLLMYASPSLCSMHARALRPRQRPFAGGHGPLDQHILFFLFRKPSIAPQRRAKPRARCSWMVKSRAVLGRRAGSRTRARVAAAVGDTAALPPRYPCSCCFGDDSTMSTLMVATIGACRTGKEGRDVPACGVARQAST